MRTTALCVILCRCLSAQTAGIQGTAINSVSHEPIAGVHISAILLPRNEDGPTEAYGAISRQDGHFSIAALPPATYVLIAARNGFVYAPEKVSGTASLSVSITLKPGEQRIGVAVKMRPSAVITGRVTDEFGDPVRNALVSADPASPDTTFAFGDNGTPSSRTDDRGQFRLSGPPGKYRIKAAAPAPPQYVAPEIRTDGSQPAVYGATWYPASDNKDHAAIVEAAPGRENTGTDIRLIRLNSVSLSGIVTGLPGSDTIRANVYLLPFGDIQQQFNGMRTTLANAGGKFVFTGVPAGNYRIFARVYPGSPQWRSPLTDIRVDNADATINLTAAQGEEITGAFRIEGDKPGAASSEKRTVTLQALSQLERAFAGQNGDAEIAPDGSFKIASVFPGRYRPQVTPLPDNAYIKSVNVDGIEARAGIIDLSHGVRGSRIRIVVSRNGGQLEGSVLEADGQPQRAAMIFVALADSPDNVSFETMKRIVPGTKFSFTGIRPGNYRLLVFDPFSVRDLEQKAKELFPDAPEIEIQEGARIVHDIRLPKREEPDAKSATK